MPEPIVDKVTGKVTFPKPEAKAAAAAPVDMAYIAIPKAVMGKLAGVAVKDGFTPDAETPKGKQNQTSKACRTYILLAIEMYLVKRAG